MEYYVNCICRSDALAVDIKQLIPEMNIRRRMSRVVKMGVCTGLESLLAFEQMGGSEIDAIITATSLGAIADSEKFLSNIITSEERMLNPTPFIQSTFNTVGAQIALIRKKSCYNNTFVHRNSSFESALLDAMLRIECGSASAVLLGLFDEVTPTIYSIYRRLGLLRNMTLGEGAIFFVLTAERHDSSVAKLELRVDGSNEDGQRLSDMARPYWSGAVVEAMAEAIDAGRSGVIINDVMTTQRTALMVEML